MPLFKDVKKPVIKGAAGGASEISALRPRYIPKTAPCAGHCPNGNEIRELMVSIAQAEAYGRTNEQAFELVWQRIAERNPFPGGLWARLPAPLRRRVQPQRQGWRSRDQCDRTLHWRLRHRQEPEALPPPQRDSQGKSCRRWRRPCRAFLRLPVGAPRIPRHRVRGVSPRRAACFAMASPKYRLPREVLDAEITRILELGVELKCDCMVGRDISLERGAPAISGRLRWNWRAKRHQAQGARRRRPQRFQRNAIPQSGQPRRKSRSRKQGDRHRRRRHRH